MVTSPKLPDYWKTFPDLKHEIPTAHNWRTFKRIEIAPRYAICIVDGIVFDTKRKTFLEPNIDNRNGRRRFRLNCDDKAAGKRDAVKVVYAARLILTAVYGSQDRRFQAHHKDGVRTNDTWQNLSWVTGKANKRLAADSRQGENNPNKKLTHARLSDLIFFHDQQKKAHGHANIADLTEYYGISADHLRKLVTGKSRAKEVEDIRAKHEGEREKAERAQQKAQHTVWLDKSHPFYIGED